MSNKDLSRRTKVEISFAGVNITKSIQPYLLSLSYTDNEEGEADDLQLTLQDRDGLWLEKWLAEAVETAAAGQLKMQAVLVPENWQGGGQDRLLDCGTFELDSVTAQAPPATVTIKGNSLPYSARIRQTLRSKAWEAYSLSGIAGQLAAENGLGLMYEAANDPFYSRAEQVQTSESREIVDRAFGGSLPRFVAAFTSGKALTAQEAAEIRRLIDQYEEV